MQEQNRMQEQKKIPTITRDELKKKIDSDDEFVLLEALSRDEFEKGHLPNARHLPLEKAQEKASQLIPNRKTPVVVYCSGPDCDASLETARKLHEMGYENLRRYEGGKAEWKQAGYRMVQPATARA